jgi:putative colanic acid biosynthesis UDP-glucose lipid carrier transferase
LRRLARPGLTGWAQVNGRVILAECGGDVRVLARHDVEYARSWSLWRDIRILTNLLTG